MKSRSRPVRPLIVGIGGTAREHSTTEKAVTNALKVVESLNADSYFFNGTFICGLPLFDPSRAARTESERKFIETIRACQGVIIGTPGYHGSLSGPVKNVLDLLEDTAKDETPYLDGRAFGCIVTASGWQACGTTLTSLRVIAHALRAWPTPFGATLNVSQPIFDAEGSCIDGASQRQLATVATQVVEFARNRAAGAKVRF